MSPVCPVCRGDDTCHMTEIDALTYWRCRTCVATFLDPSHRPTASAELAEYDLHQNAIDDPGYREFLKPAAQALHACLSPGAEILDYGCGPGPALADMLSERGHRVSLFDPFYQPDHGALQRQYDGITCTEVIEHFHNPAAEFKRLDALLRPGGWLVVMTRFQTDDHRFAKWHYRRDPTHVVFYRTKTLELIGTRLGWTVECRPPQLALIHKRLDGY